jgi:hypothetical protein
MVAGKSQHIDRKPVHLHPRRVAHLHAWDAHSSASSWSSKLAQHSMSWPGSREL